MLIDIAIVLLGMGLPTYVLVKKISELVNLEENKHNKHQD